MMKKWLVALLLSVVFCVCALGALADNGPALTLTNGTVEIGEMVEADVESVEGADHYRLRLMQGDTEIYSAWARTPGKVWVATTFAQAGQTYSIIADALDADEQCISSSGAQTVSITASSAAEGSIVMRVKCRDQDYLTPQVGNLLYASAYAPGADRVYFVLNSEEINTPALTWGSSAPEDLTLSAIAVYENGGSVTTVAADPVTVHYQQTAPAGSVSLAMLNDHFTLGQDIVLKREDLVQEGDQVDGTYTVSFNDDANAQLFVNILESADERNVAYSSTFEDTGTITIPAIALGEVNTATAYGLYLVVEAENPGYGLVYDKGIITFDDSDQTLLPEGYEIRLLVNGWDTSVSGIKRHDYDQLIQISAHPVEGAALEEVLLYHGTEVETLSEWGEWNEWVNSEEEYNIELTSGFWTDATYVALARYRTDEGEEIWSRSNIVVATLAEDEEHLPSVSVTVPRTVTRGDWLPVTITNWPENVEWFYLDLENENGEHYFHADNPENGTGWSIPTVSLEPGYYHVTVGNGAVGMGDGDSANVWFHVLEAAEPSGIVWNFTCAGQNGPTAETLEPFTVSVYAPGADHIDYEMWLDSNGWYMPGSNGGGDLLWLPDLSFPTAGTLTMTVHVFDENGHETATDSRQIEITAEAGLDSPTLTVPETVTTGGTLSVSFSSVENAADYYLRIVNVQDRGNALYENHYSAGQELTLSGEDLWWLQEGTQYLVSVEAMARNYNSAVSERRFMGTAPESTETKWLTLNVNGSADDQIILSSSNTWVKLIYDEADRPTAVRVLNGDNWDFWWGEDDPYERDWGFGEDELLFYAEATWDNIDFDLLWQNDWQMEENGEWREFDWNRDVNWTGKTNTVRVSVTSPNGEMKIPSFSLDKEDYDWGEDLVLTIEDECPMDSLGNLVKNGWFFCNISIKRTDEYGNTWWDQVNHNYGYFIVNGENRIPTYNLEPDGVYLIEIGADAQGYTGISREARFTIGSKPDESAHALKYFTVNGATGSLTAETNVDLTLAGYMSGAEWYDVEITREGDEGWYNNRSQGDGMLYDEWNADVAGVYTLTAYGYYHLLDSEGNSIQDENGSDIGRDEIGTVTVTVEAPHGDLGEVSVDLPDKVYVGDSLTVHFNETQHAETYSFWVHDGFYEWLTGDSRNGHGDLTIDTRKLPSGVYWVELDVDAPGYNQSHTTLHFALLDHSDTDCSDVNGVYYFTISTNSVQTQDGVHLIAYIPGAGSVKLYAQRDNEDLEEIERAEGPGLDMWYGSGLPGTYNIYLGADGWPEPVLMATLVVENPNGNLDAPTLIINGNEEGYTVSANTDDPHTVTVTVPKVENAESYFIQMGPANEGWKFYQEGHHTSKFEGDQIQISITDDQIEPGRMYEVSCEVHARGYTSASINRTFLLQGRQEKTVTLSVEDQAEYWTAMPVWFHAEAAGATAIRVHMNNEWRYFRGNEVDDQFTIWDQDTLFYAFATTDQLPEDDNFNWDDLDLNWSMQSDPVHVFANTQGPTSVPSMDVPESVTRGDWLVFTINEDGDARQMDVRIFDDDGNEMEFRRLWETGAHQLPTANLEANRDYRIYLCCIQDQHMWNDGPDYWFHVNDPADGQTQAFFRIDKTDIYPGEPFIPTIYAPGAEQVKIMLGGGIWLECDGDNATNDADWEWFLEEPGVYTFEAYAQYGQETEWIPVNTVTVNVRERIRLARAEITVDDVVNATQEIDIQISAVEHGYDYILQLHYQGQEENSWLRWTKTSDESENGIITFTIPAGTLEVNQPYWIDCYVSPSGRDGNQYEGSDSSRNILTTDGSATDASIQVSLNGSWDRDNAQHYLIPVNAGFEVMVTPTGNRQPTAIVVRMGDHSEYRFFDGQPIGMSEYQAWPETIYAQAYYGDLSEYDHYDDVPWDSLAWGNPSSIISVRFTSNGNAQPAEISYPGLVMAGQDLVVHVTLGENANEAHANLDRNQDGGWEDLVFGDWIGKDPSEGMIIIPTAGLECRQYRLYVDNSGEGYENSRATGFVDIVDDPYQSESKLKLPSGLTEIEDEAFEGILADTVIIPAGVNTIGSRAFADSNVRLVVLEGEVNDIAADAFEGSNLWVIYGSGQNASNWAEAFNAVFYEMGN